jgi:PAS domain S-box-containing protein
MEEDHVRDETELLRARLLAAQETLEAIRRDVDAIVVEGPAGPQVYTVTNAHQHYRMIVEEMQQGAVVLTPDGDIFYCNRYFADLVRVPLERMVGRSMVEFVEISDRPAFEGLMSQGTGTLETVVRASDGTGVPVYITANLFSRARRTSASR